MRSGNQNTMSTSISAREPEWKRSSKLAWWLVTCRSSRLTIQTMGPVRGMPAEERSSTTE